MVTPRQENGLKVLIGKSLRGLNNDYDNHLLYTGNLSRKIMTSHILCDSENWYKCTSRYSKTECYNQMSNYYECYKINLLTTTLQCMGTRCVTLAPISLKFNSKTTSKSQNGKVLLGISSKYEETTRRALSVLLSSLRVRLGFRFFSLNRLFRIYFVILSHSNHVLSCQVDLTIIKFDRRILFSNFNSNLDEYHEFLEKCEFEI
ncbi:hypothetical protein QTP88_012766 [Uroleucon formosanum]